jgi:outer membrane receptor protein involved in Fe transport
VEDDNYFIKFYDDGTGTYADDQDFNPFTWSITDNKLTLNPTTSYYEKEVWNISMKDNTMTLEISGQDFYNKLTCKKK